MLRSGQVLINSQIDNRSVRSILSSAIEFLSPTPLLDIGDDYEDFSS